MNQQYGRETIRLLRSDQVKIFDKVSHGLGLVEPLEGLFRMEWTRHETMRLARLGSCLVAIC